MYQLTESRREEQSDMAKLILSFPRDQPNIRVAPVNTDPTTPTTPDYTGFNIFHSQTGELLNTFRADDIVQQRGFMAALSSRGSGLFSQPHNGNDAAESASCTNSVCPSSSPREQAATTRQRAYSSRSQNSELQNLYKLVPKSFEEVVKLFPSEFYFPNFELPTPHLPGVQLPKYRHSRVAQDRTSTGSLHPRKVNFRPPHGPPTNYPSMVGCGLEAGLEPGQIAVWDQENKFYYFLDCNCQKVLDNDPRQNPGFKPSIRKSQITVQKGQSEKLSLPPCDPAVVHATAERASRQPHGCVLRAFGKSGRDGRDGLAGAEGKRGANGVQRPGSKTAEDRTGSNGAPGRDGRHGEWGEDGGMGKNVIVELYGDAKELGISGTCLSVARLGGDEYEEVLFVDCSGGDGGEGGSGGNGGKGGDGGDGAKGPTGGEGGHGADGGEGGRGGSGGNGGSGGRGGNCIVRASDPRLLMLVEVNCEPGRSGKGGRGGSPGKGGQAGYGGVGGTDPSVSAAAAYAGIQGKPGMTGGDGEHGVNGEPGLLHKGGSIQWEITSADGCVEHSATTRYEAEVLSMRVSSCTVEGAYEPHQRIQVTDLVVVNSGGLPLPAGAKLSIPSTETVQFEPITYELPQLAQDEQLTIPTTFRGRIVDEPSPNTPGPLTQMCRFAPRIEILGRQFEKSHLEQTLIVEYPVKLAYALAKKDIGQGEVTTLEVGIENSSSVPYGTCDSSGGSVLIHILLDSCLRPLGLGSYPSSRSLSSQQSDDNENERASITGSISSGDSSNSKSFAASYDPNQPNSIFVLVKDLQPGAVLSIPIVVQLEKEAELNDTCLWQTELFLRGKLVEYSCSEMRVAPEYFSGDYPLQLADVLLIKTDDLYEEEMAFWQRIFELLGVTYDYWNANYHKESEDRDTASDSLNRPFPPFQQAYKGKLIVYPHCDLTKLPSEDIISHFHDSSETDASSSSSMLLFLDGAWPNCLEEYIHEDEGNKKLLRHLCRNEKRVDIAPELYSGHHLFSPGTVLPPEWTLKKAQKGVLKRLEQGAPARAPLLMSHSDMIHRQGMTYTYGKLNVRRCPLPRTSNFQCIDGAASRMINMGMDDPYLSFTSQEAPLASNFGQVFLATLAGLPLHLKLSLLRQSLDKSSPLFIEFHLPNGATLTKRELAAVCIARDITDEVLAGSSDLQRMHSLETLIQELCSSKMPDETVVMLTRLLDLIKREASHHRLGLGKTSSSVAQAAKELATLCSSATQHLPSPTPSNLPPLPHLTQLQDSLAVLRPHQLTTDKLFDISR